MGYKVWPLLCWSSEDFERVDGINFGMTMSRCPVIIDRCDEDSLILTSSFRASWKIFPLIVTRM